MVFLGQPMVREGSVRLARLLLTVLDAVYVDTRGTTATVTIRPKAVFKLVFTEAESLLQPVRG